MLSFMESQRQGVDHALSQNALEVRGDSMIEAGIHDGDTVIIRKAEAANTGDIVVALVDGSEATLKRLRRRSSGRVSTHARASKARRSHGAP